MMQPKEICKQPSVVHPIEKTKRLEFMENLMVGFKTLHYIAAVCASLTIIPTAYACIDDTTPQEYYSSLASQSQPVSPIKIYNSNHRQSNSLYISTQYAANPENFEFVGVNGRTMSEVSIPCDNDSSLIPCAIKKLKLIGVTGEDTDGYNAQEFYFQNTNGAQATHTDVGVVVVTYFGLKDDAINSQRYRVSFEKKKPTQSIAYPHWQLVQYGYQVRCDRGDVAGQWVKEGCP